MVSLTGSSTFHQSHAIRDANRSTNGAKKMIQSGRKNSYRIREIMEDCIRRESIFPRGIEFVRRFHDIFCIVEIRENKGEGKKVAQKGKREREKRKAELLEHSIAMDRAACHRSSRRHGSIKRVTNGRENSTRDRNSQTRRFSFFDSLSTIQCPPLISKANRCLTGNCRFFSTKIRLLRLEPRSRCKSWMYRDLTFPLIPSCSLILSFVEFLIPLEASSIRFTSFDITKVFSDPETAAPIKGWEKSCQGKFVWLCIAGDARRSNELYPYQG